MILPRLASRFMSDYQVSSERLFGIHNTPKKLTKGEKRLHIKAKKKNKIAKQSRRRNRN